MMRAVLHLRMLLSLVAVLAFAVAVLTLATPPRPAFAGTTITVTTKEDEFSRDGDCSMREALRAANTDLARDRCPAGSGNDTIVVPAGTYTFAIAPVLNSEPYDGAGDLDLLDAAGVTIQGAGPSSTIIDAAGLDRVFDISAGTATISGVTVKNGNTGVGGGITNSSTSTLILINSIVSGNKATSGGGGIYTSTNGGGAQIQNSIISGNAQTGSTANSAGGGVLQGTRDSMQVQNSTISGNSSAAGGGGLKVQSMTMTNSTVSGNKAASGGGGIETYLPTNTTRGDVTLTHVTLNGNSAPTGANFRNQDGTVKVRSTIIANPLQGGNCSSSVPITSQGFNLEFPGTGCGAEVQSNPLLAPLAFNGGPTPTHALQPGSAAIDIVTTGCPPPTTDQRGIPRAKDGDKNGTVFCDIGAYERNDVISPRVTAVAPTNGRTGVPRNTNLFATFSEKMIPSSINKLTFKLYRCPSLTSTNCTSQITNTTVALTPDGLKAVLNPYGTSSSLLPGNSKYKAIIGGARDLAGNPLDQSPTVAGNQPMVWYFTTGST